MDALNWAIIPVILLVGIFLLLRLTFRRRIPKGLHLPPGPPGKFILANISDIPTHHEWETFTEWGRIYGDLVHIKVLNTDMIFANSEDIAHELFEKRSSIYSDRPHFTMLNELMGLDWDFALMHYGERWRRHRKAFDPKFRVAATITYRDIQTRHTRNVMSRLKTSPIDFMKHLRHLSGAIIMEITYGIQVLSEGDPYIQTAETAMAALAEAANPGSFMVDTFPILKYLPPWMPGAEFRRKALAWRIPIMKMVVDPFEVVKRRISAGNAESSMAASLLYEMSSKHETCPDDEEIIRNTAGVTYLAGSDITASALNSFILAMVLYPEVQREAQKELDDVVGRSNVPVFADRERLPYLDALCKEVLRWRPVVPLSIAHRVTRDDIYGKFFIPEGSVVIGNAWAMLHDERTYGPEPDEFNPDRFLRPGVRHPTQAYGFGRRLCPGRYLAEDTIFIAVVSILYAFDITRATDTNGIEIPVKPTFCSGAVSHPDPFRCDIKPRLGCSQSVFDSSGAS